MSTPKNAVSALLREYAQKIASGGSPDRMNVADGQGGITTSRGTIPKDPGEEELTADLPNDGKARCSDTPGSSPDRMNVADGQGGITTSRGTIPKDPGLADLKADIPGDGSVRKSGSSRVDNIRRSIISANPSLAPKVTPVATQQKAAAPTAAPVQLDLSQDTLAKIASSVLSTEEGISFVHNLFEKQAGEDAAKDLIREAIESANAFDQTEHIKSAAFNDVFGKAAAIHDQLLDQGITEADADLILKQASLHQSALLDLDHPLLKQAYAEGMDDAALMAAAEETGDAGAGEAGDGGMPPMDEAIPMGGEQLGEEEILALLEEMIASGEITEEEVLAAVQATEGAMPDEGDEAAMA